ncbi:zinc finger and SCAN domain-containing protein 31-like isoform X1 [Sabethes cyaneus]|uniref:zinc finger and SCAN domain-containing protein 31-like isoform X1 n=1 Tax=Sabethes cyaneus TaxID=53552 RepID=UPI00237D585A|nr:zinc finger and SCAN domain-containing protein 31-like isoform X1 [Sabethes cyaneus]
MSANDSLSECCRCCMLQKDGLVHLFVKLEEFGRPISDLIFSCSGVMVSNDDCLPQNICKACLDDLTIAARFQDRCRQSDTFLRNESIPVQNTDEMTPIESILIKIEHTDDDDDDEKSTHYTEQSFSDASLWSNLESQVNIKDGGTVDLKYECNICDRKFSSSSTKSRHRFVHTGERRHQCDICGRKFATSSMKSRHRFVHTGERRHQCDICGKTFTQKINMIEHRRVHTGERPHVCAVCSRAFAKQTHLNRHKRIHTGEQRHACGFCGKRFTRAERLKTHNCVDKLITKTQK